ncbi:hypothetical protein Poly21_29150 [Allorhodopirellula heiligendammensis]|uniref:Uncharacterized protein n=1 Tax=Allorhodopirellula heiligendammensis TaxID=2714739 RepID=A0A5C6BUJ4_9BACT|nr:hypothetical protein Poly21_29150 [Allorhodopirellula heiligendammensis]
MRVHSGEEHDSSSRSKDESHHTWKLRSKSSLGGGMVGGQTRAKSSARSPSGQIIVTPTSQYKPAPPTLRDDDPPFSEKRLHAPVLG